MKHLRIRKLSIDALRCAPMFAALVMCIHVGLLLVGVDVNAADYTFSLPFFPWLVCMVWSKACGFCILHRLNITYCMVVTYCIKYEQDYGFGDYLMFARILVFSIGVIIILSFISINHRHHGKLFKVDCQKRVTESCRLNGRLS